MKRFNTRDIVKYLVWAYVILLIFDGALRKWFLTPLSDVLLVSRIPLTLLIYLFALQARAFVINGWVAGAIFFTITTIPMALLTHGNAVVAVFGVIANFISIPLIFVIPRVMDYYDVEKLGRFLLYLVIPMTFLIALQFYSPQEAWVNRSVGGDVGAGFYGALDRFRPPGTFSFITGVAQFYALVFAFFLTPFINRRTLPMWLLFATGVAFVMAIYGSISRLLAVSIIIIFIFAVLGLVINGRKLHHTFRIGLALIVIFVIASRFAYFQDGVEAFTARWESAKAEDEEVGIPDDFFMRFEREMLAPFVYLRWDEPLGRGLGAGTNVGAKLLVGQRAFLAGEGEWGRILTELGPIFGLAFVFYRMALTAYLGLFSYRILKTGNFMPWLIFSSAFFIILAGQWGQQTTQGFAILSAGLLLASGVIRKRPEKKRKAKKRSQTSKMGESQQPEPMMS